ncbi:hypothetical protein WISP_11043 [Willisornis vidua]|uniref:Uncharacterized protein n=1 Tax=Willisornis vidua TaxID=1566151 RepID=A0ABQ9DWQ4_9PASS|nr:hypothetical protein WISP_11043 [Willisornis vidua]
MSAPLEPRIKQALRRKPAERSPELESPVSKIPLPVWFAVLGNWAHHRGVIDELAFRAGSSWRGLWGTESLSVDSKPILWGWADVTVQTRSDVGADVSSPGAPNCESIRKEFGSTIFTTGLKQRLKEAEWIPAFDEATGREAMKTINHAE